MVTFTWRQCLHGGNASCGGDVYPIVPVEVMSTKYPMVPAEAMFTKYLTVPVEAMVWENSAAHQFNLCVNQPFPHNAPSNFVVLRISNL